MYLPSVESVVATRLDQFTERVVADLLRNLRLHAIIEHPESSWHHTGRHGDAAGHADRVGDVGAREPNTRFGHGIERLGFQVGITGARQHPGMMLVCDDEKNVGLLGSSDGRAENDSRYHGEKAE